jgi:uncharacterized membrane protein
MVGTQTGSKTARHLTRKILYAVFVGVAGTVFLVFFLSTFLHAGEFSIFLPLIIAFNTAMTGYALIEKTKNFFSRKVLSSMLAGTANVLLAHSILNILFWIQSGAFICTRTDLAFFIVIGILCSGLGGALAVRYFKLGKSSGNRHS